MANAGQDTNGSQFFITTVTTSWWVNRVLLEQQSILLRICWVSCLYGFCVKINGYWGTWGCWPIVIFLPKEVQGYGCVHPISHPSLEYCYEKDKIHLVIPWLFSYRDIIYMVQILPFNVRCLWSSQSIFTLPQKSDSKISVDWLLDEPWASQLGHTVLLVNWQAQMIWPDIYYGFEQTFFSSLPKVEWAVDAKYPVLWSA